MAQQLYFSRDSVMTLEIGDKPTSKVWKIPVLEGFSFSQATNVSEITLNEMEAGDGTSRRGRRAFNDSLAPVEFSFSTYARPFKASGSGSADSAAHHHAVEEALWALFSGPATYDNTGKDFGVQTVHDATDMNVSFELSNAAVLGPTGANPGANLYFEFGDTAATKVTYKLGKIVLNEASIDFDIDGVATINWTGFADTVTQFSTTRIVDGAVISDATVNITTTDTSDLSLGMRVTGTGITGTAVYIDSITDNNTIELSAAQSLGDAAVLHFGPPEPDITEAILATNNFIRNRLTKVFVVPTTQDPDGDSTNELEDEYVLTLTGGNITLSNNVTYLTPEELGVVNVPIGHVTGTRSYGGSMTCYLTEQTTGANATKASKDFFDDLKGISNIVSNSFKLVFLIGGGTDIDSLTSPGLRVEMATCHVDIPTHSVEDIVQLETTFSALPSTIDAKDEVALIYKGDTPNVVS